ncbi:MAG TPA: DUF302 domain-containing protein [Nitrospinota bacterium]|jgi:uncharacterized protein (DUF302 family)|nr:DUF302 domain-containing protein [Nitrospinota bacterium]
MRILLLPVVILTLLVLPAYAGDNGLVSLKSSNDVKTTIDRLESVLKEKGMTIFKRVNHTEGAKKVGLKLRPTELLIFGNPKVGTPLMQCRQSAAIDLPQKALAWEDDKGQVWLSYNNPVYIATRHNILECDKVINKIKNALGKFTKKATANP